MVVDTQGADKKYVANHCMYELGFSDQLRCNLVPYRRDAGWRDMPAAHNEELCYMKAPMAMKLTKEQYTDSTISSSIWSRQLKKIPSFMIKVMARMPLSDLCATAHAHAHAYAHAICWLILPRIMVSCPGRAAKLPEAPASWASSQS